MRKKRFGSWSRVDENLFLAGIMRGKVEPKIGCIT